MLQVAQINPTSVLRVAALLAVTGLVLFLAGTAALYTFLDQIGAVRSVNQLLAGAFPTSNAPAPTGPPVLTLNVVLKVAGGSGLVMAVFGVLLLTVLAVLYNQVAAVTGGPRVTLAEHKASPAGQRAIADPARRPPSPAGEPAAAEVPEGPGPRITTRRTLGAALGSPSPIGARTPTPPPAPEHQPREHERPARPDAHRKAQP